jgi:hypothetical protein
MLAINIKEPRTRREPRRARRFAIGLNNNVLRQIGDVLQVVQ